MCCFGRLKGRAHSAKTSLWTQMGEAREGGREDGGGGSLWCPGIEESRWLRPLTHPLFSPFSLPHKFLRRAPPSSLRPKLIIPSCVWYFFPGGIFCFSSKGQSSPRV